MLSQPSPEEEKKGLALTLIITQTAIFFLV
jgi:hypothetical protein